MQLSLTVESAGPDIFNFAIIFATCATGFSFSAVILFSDELKEYATFLGAVGCLMNAIFGNFNSDELYNANRVVGVAFIYLWLVLANTLLLNFCIAILSHHYSASMAGSASRTPTRAGPQERTIAPLAPLTAVDDISQLLDMKGVKLEAIDKYQVDSQDDGFGMAANPRRSAWEEQAAVPADSNHWQLLQMLEDVKLSLSKLTESHRATAGKVDLIWDRLEQLDAGQLVASAARTLPGEVHDPEAAWGGEGEGGEATRRARDGRESGPAAGGADFGLTRSRAKIGGMAGKSLAPDKDA